MNAVRTHPRAWVVALSVVVIVAAASFAYEVLPMLLVG